MLYGYTAEFSGDSTELLYLRGWYNENCVKSSKGVLVTLQVTKPKQGENHHDSRDKS